MVFPEGTVVGLAILGNLTITAVPEAIDWKLLKRITGIEPGIKVQTNAPETIHFYNK